MPIRTARRTTTAAVVALLVLALAAPAFASVRVVTYSGYGKTVNASTTSRLTGTGDAFRGWARRLLLDVERHTGSECTSRPTLTVKTWRSDGYAWAPNVWTCPGGYAQLAVRRDGHWFGPRELGTQDGLSCRDLSFYRVPSALVPRCYTSTGRDVAYRRNPDLAGDRTAAYAARLFVEYAEVNDVTAATRWGPQSLASSFQRGGDDGGFFDVGRCFGRSDPRLGQYVAPAERGCDLRVDYYADGYAEQGVLRIVRATSTRWKVSGIRWYAGS